MTGSSDSRYRVSYRYGHDGERIGKYSVSSSGGSPTETLYFNKMWTWRYNGLQSDRVGQNSKHIYLGDTRILTKIARADGSFTNEESLKQYYYHSDHLGSAQLITNADGQEYERIEYTPYGELWVEKASALSNIDIPYRFTGKEMDEETGLYYYGARYLDPKTSRWLSADPALGEYIPGAPINEETRKRNGNLPGLGGVYNTVNLHLYHYAGNNPVKYVDPDGRTSVDEIQQQISAVQQQYAGIFNSDAYDTSEGQGKLANLLGQLTDLYGQYNNAVISQGNLNIQDYIQGGVLTGGFDKAQGLTGNYQTNSHCGVDGVGGYAKTPFYTSIIGADDGRSNSLTLDIIGTGLHMQILHGDEGSFMRSGGSFSPGQKIMPFPKLNNSPESSTAPHFHFQIANGSQFVSPFTMKASSTLFKYTNDGGKTWSNFRTDF